MYEHKSLSSPYCHRVCDLYILALASSLRLSLSFKWIKWLPLKYRTHSHKHKMIDLRTDKFRFSWIFISSFVIWLPSPHWHIYSHFSFSPCLVHFSSYVCVLCYTLKLRIWGTVIYLILKHMLFLYLSHSLCDIKRINTIKGNYSTLTIFVVSSI